MYFFYKSKLDLVLCRGHFVICFHFKGRNEHIAKLQTEMMRLAQQNVKLQV